MDPSTSLILVHGAATAALGAALAGALMRAARHRARSRLATFAVDPSAPLAEGRALVRGHVEEDEGSPAGPVLAVEIAPGGAWRVRAQPFGLRLIGGALLRVEPDEEPARLRVDQTFHPAARGDARVYATEVRAGETIHIEGEIRREIDPRATGKGYRDAAAAWFLRAPASGGLRLISAAVLDLHARRARFHLAWAAALGAALLAVHLGVLRASGVALVTQGAAAAAARLGAADVLLSLLLALGLSFAYAAAAERSRPWIELDVDRRPDGG
jgi:hypothetical protein